MPWDSIIPVLVWLALWLPFTAYLARADINNRLKYISLILAYAAFNLYFVLVVNFAILIYWLRALPVIALVVFLARFFLLPAHRRWLPDRTRKFWAVPFIFSAVVFLASIYPCYRALQSYDFSHPVYQAVLTQYPVQTGLYVIVNGGNGLEGLGMNTGYYDFLGRTTRPWATRGYEVDIMKMNTNGMMADSFSPKRLDEYTGFIDHDPVYPPCPGKVVDVVDGFADVQPGQPPSDELGNRVVIQCYEFYVTIANLRKGTINVKPGETIGFNRQLGMIGNSGTPAIPHLHLHATVGNFNEMGTAVPISMEFNYGMRNMLFIGQK